MSEPEAAVDTAEAQTTIELPQGLGGRSSTVSSAYMSTSFCVGRLAHDKSQVLIPFLTCGFTGDFGETQEERTVSATLTFDNVAFMIKRGSEEYLESIEAIETFSRNGLPLPGVRVDLTTRWLDEAAAALAAASRELTELVSRHQRATDESEPLDDEPEPEPEPEPERAPRRRRIKLDD